MDLARAAEVGGCARPAFTPRRGSQASAPRCWRSRAGGGWSGGGPARLRRRLQPEPRDPRPRRSRRCATTSAWASHRSDSVDHLLAGGSRWWTRLVALRPRGVSWSEVGRPAAVRHRPVQLAPVAGLRSCERGAEEVVEVAVERCSAASRRLRRRAARPGPPAEERPRPARERRKPATRRGVEAKTVAEFREALRKNLIKPRTWCCSRATGSRRRSTRAARQLSREARARHRRDLVKRGRKETNDVLKDLEELLERGRDEIDQAPARRRGGQGRRVACARPSRPARRAGRRRLQLPDQATTSSAWLRSRPVSATSPRASYARCATTSGATQPQGRAERDRVEAEVAATIGRRGRRPGNATRPRPGDGSSYDRPLAHGGAGVARNDGYVVFVRGAVPGDLVRARVTRSKRSFGEADSVESLEPSPGAGRPGAPHPGAPGRCSPTSASWREGGSGARCARAHRALPGAPVEAIVPAVEQCATATSSSTRSARTTRRRLVLGFHRPGRFDVIDDVARHPRPRACRGAARDGQGVVPRAGPVGLGPARPAGSAALPRGARGPPHGQLQARIVTSPGTSFDVDALAAVRRPTRSCGRGPQAWPRPRARATPRSSGRRARGGARRAALRISPDAFFQTNTEMAERLYRAPSSWPALGRERVLDLFCGIGTIALVLALDAGEVWGVEIVEEAVADAIENARLNGIDNATSSPATCGSRCAPARAVGPPDVVVVDRRGRACRRRSCDVCSRPRRRGSSTCPATRRRWRRTPARWRTPATS